jgi:hypothetical protein
MAKFINAFLQIFVTKSPRKQNYRIYIHSLEKYGKIVPVEYTIPIADLSADRMIVGSAIKFSNDILTLKKVKSRENRIY